MDEQTSDRTEAAEVSSGIDQYQLRRLQEKINEEQSMPNGIVAGIVAATLGAAIWAIITVVTDHQIGWMAVGIGFLVGFSVRKFGKGVDTSFGVIGAVLSLLGCLAGNLFSVCYVVSVQESIPFFDLLPRLNPEIIVELMKATFSPIDILFYGIAIYEGYKLSFRQLTKEEITKLQIKN